MGRLESVLGSNSDGDHGPPIRKWGENSREGKIKITNKTPKRIAGEK